MTRKQCIPGGVASGLPIEPGYRSVVTLELCSGVTLRGHMVVAARTGYHDPILGQHVGRGTIHARTGPLLLPAAKPGYRGIPGHPCDDHRSLIPATDLALAARWSARPPLVEFLRAWGGPWELIAVEGAKAIEDQGEVAMAQALGPLWLVSGDLE